MNYKTGTADNFPPRPRVLSVDSMMATPSSYRTGRPTAAHANHAPGSTQPEAPLRPDMQRALQRLQNMPPFAREREIEAGRYRQFSAEDKQILRNGE
jgi:hypothetical protein